MTSFAESPGWSHLGPVCRQTGTPHASRVERTRCRKPAPRGRDLHPLCLPELRDSSRETKRKSLRITDAASPQSEVCPHRPYSVWREQRHWIERRYYSEAVASSLREKLATSGLLRRASIELGEPLSWRNPARRASARGLAIPRSLSSADEAEIPGPAVPARRRQLAAFIVWHYCTRFPAAALCVS